MRPWRPGDETAFDLRADFARDRAAVAWDWSQGAPGQTFTLYLWSGEILGIGGVAQAKDGVWRAWAQLSATLRPRDFLQLLWLAERVLGDLERDRGVRRIEVYGHASMAVYRCLRRLKFSLFDAVDWPGVGFVLCLQRSA